MPINSSTKPDAITSARVPGPFGVDAPLEAPREIDYRPPGSGQCITADAAVNQLKSGRIIMRVLTDWHPLRPDTSKPLVVKASTLGAASQEMDKNAWCEAGGSISADPVTGHAREHVTLHLRANLFMRLPRWNGYPTASITARREWDRMLVKLKEYARHRLSVVTEAGDELAEELFGKPVEEVEPMLAEVNAQITAELGKLERDTKMGIKRSGRFGEIYLDPVV